jgi:hypothetical protein
LVRDSHLEFIGWNRRGIRCAQTRASPISSAG